MKTKVGKTKKAIVLLSGGIDSATTLAVACHEGWIANALSFSYGQRHRLELVSAKAIARSFKVPHLILDVPLDRIGGSALTTQAPIPKNRKYSLISNEIPETYVPARNAIFLGLAIAWAEAIDAQDLFIGVNRLDYSGYPDCRPEFIRSFERMANLATRAGTEGRRFHVRVPLIDMTKAQIIQKGVSLGVDFSLTLSCYDPEKDGSACGKCDSCLIRKKGFLEAGLVDPTKYRN